jgi:hypothetical protein
LLRPVLRRVQKISGGGFALELSPEAAAATKADVEGAIAEFKVPLRDEFDRLAYLHNVKEHLEHTVDELQQGQSVPEEGDFRATVHVGDALFRDGLYQLVDYWPRGDGAGRRFSTRFGMLGRAWRLGESLYRPDVTLSQEELVADWGMTREQAKRIGRHRQSIFCGALRYKDALVGMLYMDAKVECAFASDIRERFEASEKAKNLAAAIGNVRTDIADRGPAIKILETD